MNDTPPPNHDRLDALETDLRALRIALEEVDQIVADQARLTSVDDTPLPVTDPQYPSLAEWVERYFVVVFTRPTNQVRWCAEWWRHPEAIARLEALWREWESARLKPTGISLWLRDHLDHHLPILVSDAGPFARCDETKHENRKPLPTKPAPARLRANSESA